MGQAAAMWKTLDTAAQQEYKDRAASEVASAGEPPAEGAKPVKPVKAVKAAKAKKAKKAVSVGVKKGAAGAGAVELGEKKSRSGYQGEC